MRYLRYIIIFMLLLTAGAAFMTTRTKVQSAGEPYVAKVNGRLITEADLSRCRNVSLDSVEAKDEFINSLITKEVLISEALKTKIDREEPFRLAVKNFYEQSLIKTLLDRKQNELQAQPDPHEIDRYLSLSGQRVRINLVPVSDPAQKGEMKCQPQTIDSLFQDLAFSMRMTLSKLQVGESASGLELMGCDYSVQLAEVTKSGQPYGAEEREKIVALMTEAKREQNLQAWIRALVKQADIEVNKHKIEAFK